MEPDISLPFSQEPTSDHYPEQEKSNSDNYILFINVPF